jgi:hypothetical protein
MPFNSLEIGELGSATKPSLYLPHQKADVAIWPLGVYLATAGRREAGFGQSRTIALVKWLPNSCYSSS